MAREALVPLSASRYRTAAWVATAAVLVAVVVGVPQLTAGARIAVVSLLIAPVCEETVFRLGLQDTLLGRGWAAPLANTATALAFALAHAATRPVDVALLTLVPAVLIGAVYQRRRALAPCIALHAGMNLVWLTPPFV